MGSMAEPTRLGLYSLSFARDSGPLAVLRAAGFAPKAGPLIRDLDAVAVWGVSAAARRGQRAAQKRGLPLIHLEEPLICGLKPGDDAPRGLLVDHLAPYYDATQPTDLENLIAGDLPLDPDLKKRARDGLKLLKSLRLSKYNHWAQDADLPEPGFVLVIDQLRGDASITEGGASAASFAQMLETARANHPNLPIYIRSHPKPTEGHFGAKDLNDRTKFLDGSANPWNVLERAEFVYTVTSQMGLEAIFAGHRPHVFGAPFYAGWGLSHDRIETPRRDKSRTAEQLFAATHLLYPKWFDPTRGRLTEFETVARQLSREAAHWRANAQAAICLRMGKWKQPHISKYLKGPSDPPTFLADEDKALEMAAKEGRRLIVWASRATPQLAEKAETMGVSLVRCEDGFLRSKGLGANLYPPHSLVFDDLGIYYDPTRPSRLESLIASAASLDASKRNRVRALIANIKSSGVTKYNQGEAMPTIPSRQDRVVLLVPGQVEDDASIRLGCGPEVNTNLALIHAAREANPDAFLIYKPHPDVEADLRDGKVEALPSGLVDLVAEKANASEAIAQCDEVWTMTSLMGFEALMRGKRVVTLGAPFYAGWGLSDDRGPKVYRRKAKPSLEGLVHATLLDYPTYLDPMTGRISSAEATIEVLARGKPTRMPGLARLQYAARKYSWLWRR